MTAPFDPTDPTRFEQMYRDDRTSHGLPTATPWDIGGPQPVVQQLVALGAIKGEVLDPGTGPGHHAIYYASKGYSATGIDGSPGAIERARANAEKPGCQSISRWPTPQSWTGSTATSTPWSTALSITRSAPSPSCDGPTPRRCGATRPGARLYMFEFGEHNINGFKMLRSLSESDFRDVLPDAGWDITYLGTTTYQVNISAESIELMAARNPDMADEAAKLLERFRAMEPWLDGSRVYAPFWEVHATRAD